MTGVVCIALSIYLTLPSSKFCPVHHIPLRHAVVFVTVGLITSDAAQRHYWKIREQSLPDAHEAVYAGCLGTPGEFRFVNFCPECRKAAQQYRQQYGIKWP